MTMKLNKFNRRTFCVHLLHRSALVIGVGAVATACGGGNTTETTDQPAEEALSTADPCTDFSSIEPAELEKRKALGYVEKSPIPDNICENCKLFIPWEEGSNCGGCQLFKGPVFLDAYCTYWADPEI